MGKKYVPELGQAAFGCPTSEYECPEFVEVGLRYLECEIERVWWNVYQEKWWSAFDNTGGKFDALPEFTVRSYDWSDNEDTQALPNFQCRKFQVRWYKYLGRGMSMNKDIDANGFFKVMDKCLRALRSWERRELKKKGIDL